MTHVFDTRPPERQNPGMGAAAASRTRLERLLRAAYADGLISQHTLALRLERVLASRVIEPDSLVGDLYLRPRDPGLRDRISRTMTTIIGHFNDLVAAQQDRLPLLALDWGAEPQELLVGRSSGCDVVLSDPTVSRRHARLTLSDGRWILRDLQSTNGSRLNGRRVGRCQLRPGDELCLGEARLRVD
jgi:hypothetical protein